MASKKDYDLGNDRRTFGIRTEFNGFKVDCIGVDFKYSLRWAQEANPQLLEILNSKVIYKTNISQKIFDIYESNFESDRLKRYFLNTMNSYLSLKKIDNFGDTNREAIQAIYIALNLKYIQQNPDLIPPYTLEQLVSQTDLEDFEKQLIERVIAARKQDRTG